MTLFGSQGNARTFNYQAGDVGTYILYLSCAPRVQLQFPQVTFRVHLDTTLKTSATRHSDSSRCSRRTLSKTFHSASGLRSPRPRWSRRPSTSTMMPSSSSRRSSPSSSAHLRAAATARLPNFLPPSDPPFRSAPSKNYECMASWITNLFTICLYDSANEISVFLLHHACFSIKHKQSQDQEECSNRWRETFMNERHLFPTEFYECFRFLYLHMYIPALAEFSTLRGRD